jgi:hypothetical protein
MAAHSRVGIHILQLMLGFHIPHFKDVLEVVAFGFETCMQPNKNAIHCTSDFSWCNGRHCILNMIFQIVFIVIILRYTLFFKVPNS